MTGQSISEEESFLIQSHALLECIARIGALQMSNPEEFERVESLAYGKTSKLIKSQDPDISIFGGQGALLACFYLFLVFPRELQNRGDGELSKIDMRAAEKIASDTITGVSTTYKRPLDTLVHFRNALSHGRINWEKCSGNLVISDRIPNTSEKFRGEFSMENLGAIAQELNLCIANYIGNVIARR